MTENQKSRRKNHFIKKGFQLNFSLRFLSLIIFEALLLAGLLWYLSLDTLTTSYRGSQLIIENTRSFLFPTMLYPALVIIGVVAVIGLIGLIFISHKIAGPLYRFEKGLKEISAGDLTHRINLRKKDQLSDLSDTLNDFTSGMENQVVDIKAGVLEMKHIVTEMRTLLSSGEKLDADRIEPLFNKAHQAIDDLTFAVDRFRTSRHGEAGDDSKGREA